jgi:putative inorganic carbon (HCO3(-)) transporter
MLSRNETSNTRFSTVIVALLSIALGGVIGFSLSKFSPIYVVGGLFGLIFVFIAILNAEVGLLALLAITFLRLSDILVNQYHAPSIAKPFVLVLLVGIALRWFFYNQPLRGWVKASLLVGMYGLMVLISLTYATDFLSSYNAFDDFLRDGMIAIMVVILVQHKEMFRMAFWALMAAGMFLGTLSVYQYLTGTYTNIYWGFSRAALMNIVGQTNDYRISGPYGSPNVYAQVMIVIVPFALERFLNERTQILRWLAGYAMVIIGLTVVITFSRGGFLSLSIVLILFGITRRTQIGTWLVLAVLILGILSFLPEQYTSRLSTLTNLFDSNAAQSDISFQGRSSEAAIGIMMFQDHPVFGVGTRNYPILYQDYSRRLGLDPRSENRSPASLYIEILAEQGIVGVFIFGALILSIYRGLLRARRIFEQIGEHEMVAMATAMTLSFTAFLTSATFINNAYPRPFWILVGLALAFLVFAESLFAPRLASAENG